MADYEQRMIYRRAIQGNGEWMLNNVPTIMQDLVADIMALNEEWCLNHPDTYGEAEIWDTGFSKNQKKFIERIAKELLNGVE